MIQRGTNELHDEATAGFSSQSLSPYAGDLDVFEPILAVTPGQTGKFSDRGAAFCLCVQYLPALSSDQLRLGCLSWGNCKR